MGLAETGRIGRIVIHPRNPDIVYAAALGHCYGPQQERGVYRTRDGGKSWERILFVDENTGASDLVMDPNNPRILFAGMWQMQIWTWGRQSGGPGSGLYVSRDGGDSWTKLEGKGLPEPPWGKIGLAMSARNSKRIYALIETNSNRDFAPLEQHQGVLWRSDDGGETWQLINSDHRLVQRPLYYTRAAAAPDDENEIHFLSLRHTLSLDGGKSVEVIPSGGDHHDMWIDPLLPDRMIIGHDQGISISTNRGKSWFRPQLPVAQMYHAHTDNRIPYYVYGNRQDGPSTRGPSNTRTGGPIPIGEWRSVGGCESGFAIPDPVDQDIVWSGCYDGILERHNLRTGHSRDVSVWPEAIEGHEGQGLRYRFQWTFPIAISPHNHQRIYVGSQYVHVTEDGGETWRIISPDLTSNDPEKQLKSGGLTPDDAGPTMAPVVFAIAESPLEEGVLWAGTNDGRVHISRDGGANWTDLTSRLPDLPPWGTISNIEPSSHRKGKAYLSVDLHQVNNSHPFIYKTEDYGQTWVKISQGIPPSVFSYVHVVREDPVREGLLYAGTENRLYFSLDDGLQWHPLQNNLPPAPIHWLTIQPHFNDLVVATYGRGFWILDDITPLQQLDPAIWEKELHFFAPRPAYRFLRVEEPMSQPGDPAAGSNPPEGASLHYYLREKPQGELILHIYDEGGELIRTYSSKAEEQEGRGGAEEEGEKHLPLEVGINRFYWDLRFEPTETPKLRTKPDEHAHVAIPERGWREQEEARPFAPLVPPGRYRLVLQLGEQRQERFLEVRKDPNSGGTLQDISKQILTLRSIREEINRAVAAINRIEWYRKQIEDLRTLLRHSPGKDPFLTQLGELEQRLKTVENEFFDLRLTGSGQDTLRWPRKLYAKYLQLGEAIAKTDFPPTQPQLQVHQLLKEQLDALWNRLAEIEAGELARANRALIEGGITPLLEAPEEP